jgi:hypothetical protein
MLTFDKIGDFNPQFLRELKSRLSWRNTLIAVVISATVQLLTLLKYYSSLPQRVGDGSFGYSEYCVSEDIYSNCKVDSFGNVTIKWPQWWEDVAVGISWVMVYGLILGGVYLLASSLAQEEKRGTLDFIRLTPQKASAIFGGKLFGVPILVYLGTALAWPLQLYAARQNSSISLFHVLSWNLLMVLVAVLLYLGAMLATMWFKAQSILFTAFAAVVTYPVICLSLYWTGKYGSTYLQTDWYTITSSNHLIFYWTYAVLTSVGIYWLYKALERRYLQPKSIVLSKSQSYLWSLLFNLFLLGFHVTKSRGFSIPFGSRHVNGYGDYILAIFGSAWLLLLIPMLLPSRQSLVEWSRHGYRKSTGLFKALLWQDKSPGILAVAVNIGVACLVWLIPIIFKANGTQSRNLLLGAVITITIATIYSSIAHWVLFWPVNNRPAWIIGIIGGLVSLPLVGATFIPWSKDFLYLISPFPWLSIGSATFLGVLLVLGLQLAVLAWLTIQLRKVLTKVGRSESYQHFVA